ncbi:MAG TPA: Na+/H+ antiporter NhaA [Acidimicrobiia bacterium]
MARRTHIRIPAGPGRFTPAEDVFVSVEALGGLALLGATIVALVWANVAGDSYTDLWHTGLTIGIGDFSISEDLQHWVNDGLMTLFFFVVGLEIKRELVDGELRDPKTAALPALAALGGMVVPAALYLALNTTELARDGWGIPVATDIAFAVGVLALLGPRIPKGLKLFLLTLAIVDDIGAILVIAVFYSSGVSGRWLGGAVAALLLIFVLQRVGARSPFVYVLPGVLLWVCMFESGVHATIAGVILGLVTPKQSWRGKPVLEQLEGALHPWTSFLIIPVFALANAGVDLGGGVLGDALSSRITLGVIVGLVVGKTVGISGAVAIAVRFRLGRLPAGVHARQILGAATLAGIGFTVSLFIAELSFDDELLLGDAKIGILVASVIAGVAGALILLKSNRKDGARPRASGS